MQNQIISLTGQVKSLSYLTLITGALGLAALAPDTARADAHMIKSVGDHRFGADLSYDFVDWGWPTRYKAQFTARADGYVLDLKVPLASGEADLDITYPSTCHASGFVKLVFKPGTECS